ncbi:Transmembrane protein 135, partial [Stegodyphus mimosarum]
MAVLSKLRELSLPYNCYEVGHTWTPDCYEAALSVGLCCLLEGMKLYAPLYLITQILQRKFTLKAFWNTIESTYTSSCFLGFNAFAFIFIFCLLRRSMGKFYYLHCSYFPAFVASFLAILIEKKNRRGPLALYVTNVASETLFRMYTARGIVKPIPNGEIYLFSVSMALFLYIVRHHGFSKDFVSVGFKYVFGKEEGKPRPKDVEDDSESNNIIRIPVPKILLPLEASESKTRKNSDAEAIHFLQKLWFHNKHSSCRHNLSCMQYILYGFLRPFIIGYIAFSAIRCASLGKKLMANPSLIFGLLTEKRTLNLGLFLGGFGGTFRGINCLLRWIFNRDHPAYAVPAAFLGGLFMKFFPSSTLSLYLMWKLIEVGYALGIQEGVLPKIRGSMLMLYATSTAVLFYASVLEPHNLKPAYLKFLHRLTQNKIGEINRHVLDIFGTHASRLYSNFWPDLDLKYTSRVFQE